MLGVARGMARGGCELWGLRVEKGRSVQMRVMQYSTVLSCMFMPTGNTKSLTSRGDVPYYSYSRSILQGILQTLAKKKKKNARVSLSQTPIRVCVIMYPCLLCPQTPCSPTPNNECPSLWTAKATQTPPPQNIPNQYRPSPAFSANPDACQSRATPCQSSQPKYSRSFPLPLFIYASP